MKISYVLLCACMAAGLHSNAQKKSRAVKPVTVFNDDWEVPYAKKSKPPAAAVKPASKQRKKKA